MDMRKLGSLEVSVVGLGCNNFGMRIGADQTQAVVDAALDAGINFFDTADVYGGTTSEELLGRALGSRRSDVVLATKFGSPVDADPAHAGASARWIVQAAEDSLRRLGTDHIDLYQQHRPDPAVAVEETLEALDRLVRDGKVREIGCSNFSAAQVTEADRTAADKDLTRFASVQNQFSLLHRDPLDDVIPACEQLGLGFLPFFPLGSGLLTGKYRRGAPLPEGARLALLPKERASRVLSDRNFTLVERLSEFAESRGHSLLELAVSWLAAIPAVGSVIAGATRPEQVAANVAAAAWRLSDADLAAVEEILTETPTEPRSTEG